MSEQFAPVGEISLCYEAIGNPDDPVLLLIVGLGAQLVVVSDDFCHRLADHGFRVVRFDNRDIGRSTLLDWEKAPSLRALLRRDPGRVPYTLADMAEDTVGLLDSLSVERAGFVGFSMGGMIAQIAAVRQPHRVSSLASVMSSTGSLRKGWPSPRFLRHFLAPRPSTAERAIAQRAAMARARGSGQPGEDEDEIWRVARLSHSRNSDQSGSRRQLAAMLATGNRTEDLARIKAPTLVLHGTADKFVHPSGAHATAAAIPGSHLHLIDGMAHDVPHTFRPQVVAQIAANARRGP